MFDCSTSEELASVEFLDLDFLVLESNIAVLGICMSRVLNRYQI